MTSSVNRFPFGTTPAGEKIERWRLDNGNGVTADVLSYGAILHHYAADGGGSRVAGRRPDISEPSLSSVTISGPEIPYYGAIVGRYANRIADGQFTLDGVSYTLPVNDRGHTLHGGPEGFDCRLWHASPALSQQDAAVALTLVSPHGDMGFPGELTVTVTYSLDAAGTLAVDYLARTDRATVVNLTNHAYFNLNGEGDILGHVLQVDADAYLPVDAGSIPVGQPEPVAGTPFDFTTPQVVGARIAAAAGYDHCYVLRASDGGLRRAATLTVPGRSMEVWTTEPGIQVYSGNKLPGPLLHTGICLETQHFPDSPNQPGYPSTVLRPDSEFTSRTEYRLVTGVFPPQRDALR